MFLRHALSHALGDRKGLRALDLCAAPGGKSTLMASMPQFSLVVCNEIIRTRVSILKENMAKWGTPHSWVTQNDPKEVGRLEGFFDVMVVDAPCSGSGLFRREPGLISEWSERNVQLCGERQQRILADALPALAQDGLLIYSTCSYSREEDEMILDWLLDHETFESLEIPVEEAWGIVPVRSVRGAHGLRFYPDRLKGEGLFMACLRKKSGTVHMARRGAPLAVAPARDREAAAPWLKDGGTDLTLIRRDDELFALPKGLEPDMLALQENMLVRKTGIRIGCLAHGEFLPDHELAVGTVVAADVPVIDLDREQALNYLRKESIGPFEGKKGWHLMRFEGAGLGWAKLLPSRVNNYYPAHWRILHL